MAATALRLAIRKAIKLKLEGDAELQSIFQGSVRFSYRPTRQPVQLPFITMYDTGKSADDIVPLSDRNYTIDIWTASDLDQAELIADRIDKLLNHQPLLLPDQEGQVAYLSWETDIDATQDDQDVTRKIVVYRLLVYQYQT